MQSGAHFIVTAGESTSRLRVFRVQGNQRLTNRERLGVTLHRTGYVAKASARFSSAHVPNSFVSSRELTLQGRVVVGFAGKAVEVTQGILNQSLPYLGRTGQRFNRIVVIEQDAIS